jgi:hypothetical protein
MIALLGGSLALIMLVTAVNGVTAALWRADVTAPDSKVGVGQVFAALYGKDDSVAMATDAEPASIAFTAADAVAAVDAGAVLKPGMLKSETPAKQFDVVLQSTGRMGMDYYFKLPAAATGTVAEQAAFLFYRLNGAKCAIPTDEKLIWIASPGEKVGTFTAVAPSLDQRNLAESPFSESWCVQMVWDQNKATGYKNTAEVTGTVMDGSSKGITVSAKDDWGAFLAPEDPAGNPDYLLQLGLDFSRPSVAP